ncbi:hypothetical protein [Actinomycetospora flava]|uniref:Uncharacterized protein n=1 Tax=Actinomycetospora flava TaxID=3129232 RepID=A0ABU8M9Z2_9PSEU
MIRRRRAAAAAVLAIAVTWTVVTAGPAAAIADGEDAPPEFGFAASLSMRLQPVVGPGLPAAARARSSPRAG